MAPVLFMRGVNVGGHKPFRPAAFAKELSAFEVLNVGAAGTFIVRRDGQPSHSAGKGTEIDDAIRAVVERAAAQSRRKVTPPKVGSAGTL